MFHILVSQIYIYIYIYLKISLYILRKNIKKKRHFVKALKFSLKIRLMIKIYIEYISKAGLTQ